MLLRLTFFLLIFANLVFYAWTQGYFGRVDADREPERLNAQLQADKLRILGTQVPAARPRPEAACRRVEGLSMADAETLKAAALAAGLGAELMPLVEPTAYLVVMPDLANDALANRKLAELRRLRIAQHEKVELDNGRWEIVLGRFGDEDAAREGLAALGKRGVRSARVEPRDLPPDRAALELRGTIGNLPQQLPALTAAFPGASLADCPK